LMDDGVVDRLQHRAWTLILFQKLKF